jgi:hypothetical protein
MKQKEDERITLEHLTPGRLMKCIDGTYREVRKVDFVYDIDAAISSGTQAVVYFDGYKELVNHHVDVSPEKKRKSRA